MPPTFTLSSSAPTSVRADLLAVPVFADRELGPGAREVDDALGGVLVEFMAETDFSAARGETLAVPTGGRLGAKAVVLVGMGARDELDLDALRRAGAGLARRSARVTSVATTLLDAMPASVDRAAAAQAFAESIALGGYQFLRYKGESKPSKLRRVVLLGGGGADVRGALERASAVSEAVLWARDLVNEPSLGKSPAEVATAARALLRGTGVQVQVWTGARLERERLGGVVGVGQGSSRPPCLLRLEYAPARANGTLALVGKGVVFDSGGLSIKPANGMETMKTDMGGAAAVIAAMSAIAALGVKTRVLGFVPLVENMPSGTAIRPGDVLRFRNGKTAEVLNTDAEGRLILADGLSLASEAKPDAIVDLATLTGACMVALGDRIAGLMANDEEWGSQVRAAADRVGEPVWPLPLPKDYRKLIDSDVADMKNIGGSYGGAITAGLFLQEFVTDAPWVHLDIAGPARASSDDGVLVKGGTGFGVRTLVELARSFEAPARPRSATKRRAPAKRAKPRARKRS